MHAPLHKIYNITAEIDYARGVLIMACIGILDKNRSISDVLKASLYECGICNVTVESALEGESYDAVLIGTDPPEICTCNADILIVADCISSHRILPLTAKSVISYGLCQKDTVTVSSLINERLVISLQREIPTFLNHIVSEQDFCIDIKSADAIDTTLGIITALLVSDVSPETISNNAALF